MRSLACQTLTSDIYTLTRRFSIIGFFLGSWSVLPNSLKGNKTGLDVGKEGTISQRCGVSLNVWLLAASTLMLLKRFSGGVVCSRSRCSAYVLWINDKSTVRMHQHIIKPYYLLIYLQGNLITLWEDIFIVELWPSFSLDGLCPSCS